ncbi:hypothetical protein M0R45_003453 [Rubus argutus]|uniref:MATE efflux family protein n=1 Tax=Rubus argutus TaxID=59490 RepID=A0AAW1YGG3_RUBAR
MEPLCSQAFGAQRPKLLSVTLHRSVIFLAVSSLPISLLWLNISTILLYLRQDPNITRWLTPISCSRSRPFHQLSHSSNPHLPSRSGHHPPAHFSISRRSALSFADESLAGHSVPPRRRRRRCRFRRVQFVRSFISCSLRLGYRAAPAHMDRAEPGVLDRLEAANPAGRAELRVRLLGMVVVRDHDRLVWPPCGPHSNRRLDGSAYPDDVVNLRVPILARIRSVDPGRERARGEPAVQSQIIGFGGVMLAFVMGLSATTFASGMRGVWGRMFTKDTEIVRLTSAALPILGLCELGNCPQTVGCGVLRGSARPSTAANVNLSAFYLVGMPVAIGLGFWLGVGFNGLWIGLGPRRYRAGCEVIRPSCSDCEAEQVHPLIIITEPSSR